MPWTNDDHKMVKAAFTSFASSLDRQAKAFERIANALEEKNNKETTDE